MASAQAHWADFARYEKSNAEVTARPKAVFEFFNSNNFLGRGINDIARNQGEIALEDTFANIVSMMEIAKANRIKPILCLLFPTTTIAWTPEVTDPLTQIIRLNSMLTDYTKAHRIKVVEYFSKIDKSSGRLPLELSHDSIHPNLDGYRIMESEILKYIAK